MGRSLKGGVFERLICRQLSLWWSHRQRDDIFWRTSTSGARATVRAKQGRSTFGQHGDIQAVDPVGAPLMQIVTLELKRGYPKGSFYNVLDCPLLSAQQPWEAFVLQAIAARDASGVEHWMLIQQHDKRAAIVFFPRRLFLELESVGVRDWPRPIVEAKLLLRSENKKESRRAWIYGTRLDNFLRFVSPERFKELHRLLMARTAAF